MTIADETSFVQGLIRSLKRGELDRREFIFLAGTMSASAILAACSIGGSNSPSSSSSSSGTKLIPFYTGETEASNLAFFVTVINAFQKDHPDVQITLNSYGDKVAATFLQTALQAGRDVGIFGPPLVLVPNWARAGYLLPLDDIIQAAGSKDAFLPGTLITINGHDYNSPFQSNSCALYYRRDIFQKAGIKSPPTTYDDLLSAIKEVNGRNGVAGIAFPITPGQADLSLFTVGPFVLQQGTGYYAYDGTLTFDKPEVLVGINRVVELFKNTSPALYNAANNDVISAYVSGKLATAWYQGRLGVNLEAQAPQIAAVTDVIPLPAGPFMTGQITITASKGYSVAAKTANPTEAKAFLTFLNSGDNALIWALTVPGQLMPGLKSLQSPFTDPNTTNPLVKANAYMQKHGNWVNLFAKQVATAGQEEFMMGAIQGGQYKPVSNINPWGQGVWGAPTIDGTMIQEILLANTPAATAWQNAITKMKTARQNFLTKNPNWKPGE